MPPKDEIHDQKGINAPEIFIQSRRYSSGANGVCGQLVLYATESGSVHLDVFENGKERGFAWTLIQTTTHGEEYAIQACTGKYLSASSDGLVSANAERIGNEEKWSLTKTEDGKFTGIRSCYQKYLRCRKNDIPGQVIANLTTMSESEHWEIAHSPPVLPSEPKLRPHEPLHGIGCRLEQVSFLEGKSSVPESIVPEAILTHHSNLRSYGPKAWINDNRLEMYTKSFNSMVEDYDRAIQDGIEFNIFYEKLKAMYAANQVVFHIPDDDAPGWNHGGDGGAHEKQRWQRFRTECAPTTIDPALPFMMAEYKHRELISILGKNYNFNTYRKLAFSIELGEANFEDGLRAYVTLILQLGVVILVGYSFVSDKKAGYGLHFGDDLPWRHVVALVALMAYMIVQFTTVEAQQLKMTGQMMNWRFSNIGFAMDVFVNVILYGLIIAIQVGVMLHAQDDLDLITNSVALLFIMQIDDEMIDLTDDQETTNVKELVAKRIFESVKTVDVLEMVMGGGSSSTDRNYVVGCKNPELQAVSTYMIPHFEWESPDETQKTKFGKNGRWKTDGWTIRTGHDQREEKDADAPVQMLQATHDATAVPITAGPATQNSTGYYRPRASLLASRASRVSQQGSKGQDHGLEERDLGTDGIFFVSDWSTSSRTDFPTQMPEFGRLTRKPPRGDCRWYWITELKPAEDIAVLHTTSDLRFRGGVFVVKNFCDSEEVSFW